MHYYTMGLLTAITLLTYTQTHAFPLPAQNLEAYTCMHCDELSPEALRSSWEVHQKAVPTPYIPRKNLSYSLEVSAQTLQTGVPIFTTAPEALIVVKPLQKEKMPELTLINGQHKHFSLQEASLHLDKIDSNSVLPKQYNLQLKPELGHGRFYIQATQKTNNLKKRYLIHVFDKQSLLSLEIVPSKVFYQYGDTYKSTLIIHDNDHTYAAPEISATLTQNTSLSTPLKVIPKARNQFEVSLPLSSKNNPQGENGALHVRVAHDTPAGTIYREARSAFSYSIPSARVVALNKISKKYLTFLANVEVSTGSRYALHSILFKLNKNNEFEPIEISQSAKWLEPGMHEINFSFDNQQQIEEDKLYIGELSMIDYGQLKRVYQYPTLIHLKKLTG